MKFEEILPRLRRGDVVTRSVFSDGLVIFMQVPAEIPADKINNMQSIPYAMKYLMMEHGVGITYHDQFIMYDFMDGSCTYYPFDGEDFNATDWLVVCSYHTNDE